MVSSMLKTKEGEMGINQAVRDIVWGSLEDTLLEYMSEEDLDRRKDEIEEIASSIETLIGGIEDDVISRLGNNEPQFDTVAEERGER